MNGRALFYVGEDRTYEVDPATPDVAVVCLASGLEDVVTRETLVRELAAERGWSLARAAWYVDYTVASYALDAQEAA